MSDSPLMEALAAVQATAAYWGTHERAKSVREVRLALGRIGVRAEMALAGEPTRMPSDEEARSFLRRSQQDRRS